MNELSRVNERQPQTNWREAVATYTQPRVLQVLALGFASGLPFLLTYSTLSAWLSTVGVKRAAIGAFALVGIPYSFKFLWAPLMDRVAPPLPLGRRRGWGITIQILLAGAIVALGMCNPKQNLLRMAAFAVLVAFLSASQDIVIDAWRVESLSPDQQAPGAAMIQSGYRIAMLVSGAGGLLIANYAGWFTAYATMAGLVVVGMLAFLLAPEPKVSTVKADDAKPSGQGLPPREDMVTASMMMVVAGVFALALPSLLGPLVASVAVVATLGGFTRRRDLALWCTRIVAWAALITLIWEDFSGLVIASALAGTLYRVVGGGGVACALAFAASGKLSAQGPLADFMRRPLWPIILIAIFGYKLGEAMAGVMSTPLYISLGFTLPEIAYASKVFGFFSVVAGALLGGVVTTRFGIRRSLIVCGIMQCAGNLFFVLQAVGGHRVGYLALCVTAENITGAMAGTALVTWLSSLCSPAFTATQYALLAALASLGRTVVASSGGALSEKIGWVNFFLLTSIVALPAIALIFWVGPRDSKPQPGSNRL